MKYLVNILFSLLFVVVAGCSDDNPGGLDDANKGKITLSLSAGDLQTRTLLNSSAAVHQVEEVYIALYEIKADETDTVCVECYDFNWESGEPLESRQERTFTYPAQEGVKYTILAIGLDKQSATTFGFSSINEVKEKLSNKSLSQSYAILQEGIKTASEGDTDTFGGRELTGVETAPEAIPGKMAPHNPLTYSELFAGWNTFVFNPEIENLVEVEMRRRVAGVYAYLKEIPRTVNGKDVARIKLLMNRNQNYAVALPRVERTEQDIANKVFPDDFGKGELLYSEVLMDICLKGEGEIGEPETPTDNPFWDIKEDYTTKFNIKPNTLLLSSYLLPVEKNENNTTISTLYISLFTEDGALIQSFPLTVKEKDTETKYYNIYPNMVYHVGEKSNNGGVDEGDQPVSLAGVKMELEVEEWTLANVNVEFPEVPIYARMSYTKEHNQSTYIYDCINTEDQITISPSFLKKNWKLTVMYDATETDPDYQNWIYIKKGNEYVESYESSGEEHNDGATITFRINDFVVRRDLNVYNPATSEGQALINKDYREAYFVLTTEGAENNPQTLVIRQYNAFTVVFDGGACGVSRFDKGVVRDKDGNITNNGIYMQWGFYNVLPTGIFGLYGYNSDVDGEVGYNYAKSKNHRDFNSSALKAAWTDGWNYDGTQNIGDSGWYLPAQYELSNFFDKYVKYKSLQTFIVANSWYWTATARGGHLYDTYYQKKTVKEEVVTITDSEERGDRRTNGYLRLAHHF